MKWIILLLLIAGFAALIMTRYRRQIQTAIYVWKMFRKMRRMDKPPEKQIERRENISDVQLVRCAKCGTWTPQKRALKMGAKTFFCSAKCMEKAVELR